MLKFTIKQADLQSAVLSLEKTLGRMDSFFIEYPGGGVTLCLIGGNSQNGLVSGIFMECMTKEISMFRIKCPPITVDSLKRFIPGNIIFEIADTSIQFTDDLGTVLTYAFDTMDVPENHEGISTPPINTKSVVDVMKIVMDYPCNTMYEEVPQMHNLSYLGMGRKGFMISTGGKQLFTSRTIPFNESSCRIPDETWLAIKNYHSRSILTFVSKMRNVKSADMFGSGGNGVSFTYDNAGSGTFSVRCGNGYLSMPVVAKTKSPLNLISYMEGASIRVHGVAFLTRDIIDRITELAEIYSRDIKPLVMDVSGSGTITIGDIIIPVDVRGGKTKLAFTPSNMLLAMKRIKGTAMLYYQEFAMTPVNIVETGQSTEICLIQIPV